MSALETKPTHRRVTPGRTRLLVEMDDEMIAAAART
jgi:Arc/MetJ family transcription regulator